MLYRNRLVLETTYNTRELGGIPIGFDSAVKWGQLLRSDDISSLSTKDIEKLQSYGVDTIIDLRTKAEREETGYILEKNDSFKKHYISLMIADDVQDITQSDTEMNLGDFYCELLDQGKDMIKDIFNVFKDSTNNGILFHCAAGKDRTGVISALMLNLLGVTDGDIIANYEVTYSHLSKNPDFQVPEEYAHLVNSKREHMERFLEKLRTDYENAENYLLACGLTKSDIDRIKERYIEKDN